MEMQKLKMMLDQSEIPYRCSKNRFLYGDHLEYLDATTGKQVCSVIGDGVGMECGLLEIQGLISKADTWDNVLGHLTAEKVFERIYRHYHRMPTLFPEYVVIEGDTATFATGLTRVWDDLFETNDVIKRIIIPEGVTYLESGFKKCVALEDISFPSTLREIPERSFENSCLKNISFSLGIESIGEHAFMGCKQLKRIHIPGSIKRISDAAFWQCSINDVILDDGVEAIGYLAFAENPLKSVALPKSLKELDSMAFVDQNWEPVRIIYK